MIEARSVFCPWAKALLLYRFFQKVGLNSSNTAKNSKRPRSIWMLLNHFRTSGKEDMLLAGLKKPRPGPTLPTLVSDKP